MFLLVILENANEFENMIFWELLKLFPFIFQQNDAYQSTSIVYDTA